MQFFMSDFKSLGVKFGANFFAVSKIILRGSHFVNEQPIKLQKAVARISRVNLFEQFRTLSNNGFTIGLSFVPGMYSFRSRVEPAKAFRAE